MKRDHREALDQIQGRTLAVWASLGGLGLLLAGAFLFRCSNPNDSLGSAPEFSGSGDAAHAVGSTGQPVVSQPARTRSPERARRRSQNNHNKKRASTSKQRAGFDGTTGDEVELLDAQLRALELPNETLRTVLEEDVTLMVELCLSSEESSATGLALDFTIQPRRGEAQLTEVRFRAESHARPAGLVECLQGLGADNPLPMEVIDLVEDGVFTLLLGANRPRQAE